MDVTELNAPTELGAGSGDLGVTQTPGGVKMDVDLAAPTAAQLAAPTEAQASFQKLVPDGYSDKPWVAELAKQDNPLASMFKEFENQRSLVGKKGEGLKVPGETASAEEWQQFHRAIGVPEKPEDYTYEAPKAPEGMEQYFQTDEKLLSAMRSAAHKGGVTPQGWRHIVEAFNAYGAEAVREAAAQADAQLNQTKESFAKHYGEKGPQVLANFDKAIAGAPDYAKPILNALQPATKAALAAVLFNFSSKYVAEDKLDIGGVGGDKPMSQAEYGDLYEKAFAAYHQTKKNPQGAEHLKAKQELARVQAIGRDIFKVG